MKTNKVSVFKLRDGGGFEQLFVYKDPAVAKRDAMRREGIDAEVYELVVTADAVGIIRVFNADVSERLVD